MGCADDVSGMTYDVSGMYDVSGKTFYVLRNTSYVIRSTYHFGGIRAAASRRMTEPLSIEFSTIA